MYVDNAITVICDVRIFNWYIIHELINKSRVEALQSTIIVYYHIKQYKQCNIWTLYIYKCILNLPIHLTNYEYQNTMYPLKMLNDRPL